MPSFLFVMFFYSRCYHLLSPIIYKTFCFFDFLYYCFKLCFIFWVLLLIEIQYSIYLNILFFIWGSGFCPCSQLLIVTVNIYFLHVFQVLLFFLNILQMYFIVDVQLLVVSKIVWIIFSLYKFFVLFNLVSFSLFNLFFKIINFHFFSVFILLYLHLLFLFFQELILV